VTVTVLDANSSGDLYVAVLRSRIVSLTAPQH